jgi:hypothetical protein
MARVLAHTAAVHCPGWDRRIERYTPPIRVRTVTGKQAHIDNAQKHAYWAAAVDEAPDGTPMLLMDADTMILRPLDQVWSYDFDLAYTVRTFEIPFNAGVVFLRVSAGTREFMRRWRDGALELLHARDTDSRQRLRRYIGVAQASFVALLKDPRITLGTLPCHEWNCEDSSWPSFDPAVTRIVHLKGRLRRALFPPYHRQPSAPADPHLRPLFHLWYRYQAAAELNAAERTA